MEYINRDKHFAAEQEAKETGGDVREIYIRKGGLIREKEEKPVEKKPEKKAKKGKK